MVIRLILILLPVIVFIVLLAKKKLKMFSILLTVALLVNSLFMLFHNINQDNILDMNSLDMEIVRNYYSSNDFHENRSDCIYIYDDENIDCQIAEFTDVVYKKYALTGDTEQAIESIVSSTSLLKKQPKLNIGIDGTYYYASNLKSKVGIWSFLYNDTRYRSCIIIADSDFIYYIEYEVELYSGNTDISTMLDQIFYKRKFTEKIDVMTLFEKNHEFPFE